ncbi:golgin subfamily A member 6C-like isoform X1 [Papio anubis]|uniref:golgin subfamily A member 6C-like isoform X1 n=1 Tax=Papio anubis TaxID=9555 RepID=UPI0012AE902B|nr:golgin subfamily A member 6C-like isoform X1 [Papio anubis]
MWPQHCLPSHPTMLEETRQRKLAAAKKKLKEYHQRNSPGVLAGEKTKKKKTGGSPETTTSGGCHSPGDSWNQELKVALDSSSATINQLCENIESLKQQKKQVEHQLEEEKKANNDIHKAQTEQLETINILTLEKADLKTTLYHTKRAARHFEEESKDLAGRLQYSLQRIQELERALSAVSAQQQEEDRSSSRSEAVLQRQLQQTRKERALLNTHVTQVTESLKQVQLERDEYAQHIKGERARWQERMWKMSMEGPFPLYFGQARTLKEEKKRDIYRIQELERSLSELKHQMAEPPSSAPPAGTSEVEQLQDEAKHLRKEVESLEGKLQSQVENNQALSLLSKEQKERLQEEEEGSKSSRRGSKSRRRRSTSRRKGGCRSRRDCNNENKSALQLEQQVKELQEKLSEECLEAAGQQNQQLETQLSLMALPGQGDGGGHLNSEEEGVPRPMPSVPQDLESREATSDFMDLPRDKVDWKQQVEKLELGFIQLSGATDGMREHIMVYESQGAESNTQHKEEEASRLAQNEEEMKVKLLELQDMVLPVVGDHERHDKFLPAAQNPLDEPAPGAPAPQELGAEEEQGDFHNMKPAPGQAREGSPRDSPTALKILQLLPVTQDTQEHPGLASKPCVPFFYRAAKNREINIIII